jgi:[acyl-carrier-protein] S-malonyltransferase
VIAGHKGAVERAMELAKAAGAKRSVLLPVSAPFHCPLMKPAQVMLKPELEETRFSGLSVPLVNNWQARVIQSGEDAKYGLYEQVPSPVRWTETVTLLASHGVTHTLEIGAGKVLSGLVRKIDHTLVTLHFGLAADWVQIEASRTIEGQAVPCTA